MFFSLPLTACPEPACPEFIEGVEGLTAYLTLMFHTHAEEKRVRVRQMWARAGWDRMNST